MKLKFHKHRIHKDHRRAGEYDIFPGLKGDVNFTVHRKGVVPKELHMHKKQTDYFTVVEGKVLFRIVDQKGKEQRIILKNTDHKTIIIPPRNWHGYIALEKSIMAFYISHKYDPKDEFRQLSDPKEWK